MTVEITALSPAQRADLTRYLPETTGAKLRRLAADARRMNAAQRAPWRLPPARTVETAYMPGQVVSNAGGWYVQAALGPNGTPVTSGTGPGPSHTTGNGVTDGAAIWFFIGAAAMTADDPMAPSVTVSATAPAGDGPYANRYSPWEHASAFRLMGGFPELLSSSRIRVRGYVRKAGDPPVHLPHGAVAFMTDAVDPIVEVLSGGAVRFLVDGRYVSASATVQVGANMYHTIALPGPRRPRLIEVRGPRAGLNMGNVYVRSLDTVWAPPMIDRVVAAFIGDSLWQGSAYGPWLSGGGEPNRIADLLGWSEVWTFAQGGTGFLADNAANGGPFLTYGERLPQAIARSPDVFVFIGSTNDRGRPLADITAAARAAYKAIRDSGSRAPIIQLGLQCVDDAAAAASAKVAAVELALADAVTQSADPMTFMIPIRNDPAGPWITGGWNNAARTTSANVSLFIGDLVADGVHPGELGTILRAERIASAIRDKVLPAL